MTEIRDIRLPPRIDQLPLAHEEARRGKEFEKGWKFSIDGQDFDYKNGQILLNQKDLAQHIGENLTHLGAHYWTSLSKRLGSYRDWATINVEDPEALGRFFALLHAFLTKIYGRIKKKFDETIEGVAFHLEDGQLLINGINVNACLQMVRKRQTKKGRVFLKGLRSRLAILQSNRQGNPAYEKIRETVDRLSQEIDEELKRQPEIILLPPPASLLESSKD
jgi:hypothetical protein